MTASSSSLLNGCVGTGPGAGNQATRPYIAFLQIHDSSKAIIIIALGSIPHHPPLLPTHLRLQRKSDSAEAPEYTLF